MKTKISVWNNFCHHKILILYVSLISVLASSSNSCRNGIILRKNITSLEKELILEEHNFLRQIVAKGLLPGQPGAQNMQEMKWDDELAARAQKWSETCIFGHDPSRYVDRFIFGQNVGILWSNVQITDGDFPTRVRIWFDEVRKYAFGEKWTAYTGHYMQLVWGDTNLVGCGFTYYQNIFNKYYNKLYVCNYGPGGNVIGRMPYTKGYPKCKNHGMLNSKRYPGLCSHDRY